MPRELLTIQVGQCGNQIGMRFWELALKEHSKHAKNDIYDDSLSSFFRNVDIKGGVLQEVPFNGGKNKISNLKARSVVVDMEEGVINSMMKSDIGELFDERLFINDVSGAGNNWAHGYGEYGPKYEGEILEKIRKSVEECDSLQCFLLFHSLGGGTGSGVGSYLIESLEDNFPSIYRFTASVFPSKEDDVVTSPYNSILSLNKLINSADCVLPIENQALINICNTIDKSQGKSPSEKTPEQLLTSKTDDPIPIKGSKLSEIGQDKKKEKPYDRMNNIIAHLLSNLTCSMRFDGLLNVDLNEITMNLVPYPRLHFLVSSMAPLYSVTGNKMLPRSMDQMFKDCLQAENQLICSNPLAHRYIAMGLMVRGDVTFSDVNRNIKKLKEQVNMIYWNQEGFKYGICNVPPVGQPYSLLTLSNNTCIRNSFQDLADRFNKLYKRKVYTHHYTNFLDLKIFDEAIEECTSLISQYQELENVEEPKKLPRMYPII